MKVNRNLNRSIRKEKGHILNSNGFELFLILGSTGWLVGIISLVLLILRNNGL